MKFMTQDAEYASAINTVLLQFVANYM